MSIRNLYKVPKKVWGRWSDLRKQTFNRVYRLMSGDQELFSHPKADVVPAAHWKTTSWNAAWIASEDF
jgi:hypothetical protein